MTDYYSGIDPVWALAILTGFGVAALYCGIRHTITRCRRDYTDVMDGQAGIVTKQGFPHGLRCRCGDEIPNGHAYATIPLDDDTNEIVCAACALTHRKDHP
jgi:hypothetical protein